MTDVILPTVAIVATGGTIAMKTDPVTHAPVPALSGADLVAAAPGLEKLARITVTEFSNIPSAEMGPDLWPSADTDRRGIARRSGDRRSRGPARGPTPSTPQPISSI